MKILLVDDDENDVLFVKHATEKSQNGHSVQAVHDGEDAIRYLRGEGKYSDRKKFPLPTVIVSDLKMPRLNGLHFLRWLRAHPPCSLTPTIIFSNSREEKDVQEAYRLGANAYICKPASLKELTDLLHALCVFWSRYEPPPVPFSC